MKLLSSLNKSSCANFFLYVYAAFFLLYVFHTHDFHRIDNEFQTIEEKKCRGHVDPFLDDSQNCILHAFISSIDFFSHFYYDVKAIENAEILIKTENVSKLSHFAVFNILLRAPPHDNML